MERAVPSTIFMAASTSLALRSGSLVSAISRTWSLVSLPTLSFWGPVFVDGDLDRDHIAAHGFGLGVVGLAEIHDVDPVRAERGADGRSRGGRTCLQLHLDQRGNLLLLLRRHLLLSLMWS